MPHLRTQPERGHRQRAQLPGNRLSAERDGGVARPLPLRRARAHARLLAQLPRAQRAGRLHLEPALALRPAPLQRCQFPDWRPRDVCALSCAADRVDTLVGCARRGARALALRALRHRVAVERQGPGKAHRQAAADCAGPEASRSQRCLCSRHCKEQRGESLGIGPLRSTFGFHAFGEKDTGLGTAPLVLAFLTQPQPANTLSRRHRCADPSRRRAGR